MINLGIAPVQHAGDKFPRFHKTMTCMTNDIMLESGPGKNRMSSREKQPTTPGGGPRRPELLWIPAAMIGIGINMLAAGVIALSVSIAIGTAIARGE